MSLGRLALRALRCLDAEDAHRAAILALRAARPVLRAGADDPILATRLWGLDFPNPIGLAEIGEHTSELQSQR
jgi:dihydroorotate dehydrogenase